MRLQHVRSVLDIFASICVAVAALAVGAVAVNTWRSTGASTNPPPPPSTPVVDLRGQDLTLSIRDAPRIGDPSAKIVLAEFSDFECPFCQRYAQVTFPKLRKDFIDTGKILYVYRHMPLTEVHSNALGAAGAAECAREAGKFWEMHALLFRPPRDLTRNSFLQRAKALDLNIAEFEPCIDNASAKILGDVDEARRLGINSTPTFLIGTLATSDTVSVLKGISGAHAAETFGLALNELMSVEER